jgi:hypothetical protein
VQRGRQINVEAKSLTVNIGGETGVEIYKLEWDGNIYDFAAPV